MTSDDYESLYGWTYYPPLGETVDPLEKKCECGAAKTFKDIDKQKHLHSTWCPCYKDDRTNTEQGVKK